MSERHERAHSVDDAKALRATVAKVTASIDAYATRIASSLEAHPDPRVFATEGQDDELILVSTPWEGRLFVGDDLFTQGQVFAGDQPIAQAGDIQRAQFVRSVLLHDPELTSVPVPTGKAFQEVMERYADEGATWHARFDEVAKKIVANVGDERTRDRIRSRALELLHAQ